MASQQPNASAVMAGAVPAISSGMTQEKLKEVYQVRNNSRIDVTDGKR